MPPSLPGRATRASLASASMCLLVVVSRVVPGTPLVVAGNRDERLDRAAEAMTVLREEPRTIGGRDLAAGGTWLAVNEHGVVAALTNQPMPDGPDPTKRSRGELPLFLTRFPTAAEAAAAFVDTHDPADYNPAWLLVGDRETLHFLDLAAERAQELPPGIHVLENRAIGEASRKVERVRHLLGGDAPADVVARLPVVMADDEAPPLDLDVPEDRRHVARAVGTICVHTEVEGRPYGTRWSGIVTVPDDGPPSVRYADGPPCTTPYVAASS